jgi:hypothetical protein
MGQKFWWGKIFAYCALVSWMREAGLPANALWREERKALKTRYGRDKGGVS